MSRMIYIEKGSPNAEREVQLNPGEVLRVNGSGQLESGGAAAPVQSVAGRTGDVLLEASDITDLASRVVTKIESLTGALSVSGSVGEVAMSVAIGTGSNEVCAGNDSRLSDARNPTSHTHPHTAITGLGTAATSAAASFATSAQGTKADTAVQGVTGATGMTVLASANAGAAQAAIGIRSIFGGGQVGLGAGADNGFAGGHNALAEVDNGVQLGAGTNSVGSTIQFLNAGSVNTTRWGYLANTTTTGGALMQTTSGSAACATIGAVKNSGDTITGNATLNGTANTAPNQVFGANNLMTGGLGDARYGQMIARTKASSQTRTVAETVEDSDLTFTWTAGVWEVYFTGYLDVGVGLIANFSLDSFPNRQGIHTLLEFGSNQYHGFITSDMGVLSAAGATMVYEARFVFRPTTGATGGIRWGQSIGATLAAGATLTARKLS
jgi:hypothetical protein